MPGSPYFDEIPKGLITWPKLLKIAIPISCILLYTGWKYDLLIEIGLSTALLLTIIGLYRR